MSLRNHWRMAAWSCIMGVFAVLALGAAAEEIRYHGMPLDENHQLLIEETQGVCKVGYIVRSRSTGPDLVDVAPEAPGVSPRVTTPPKFLVQISAEILKPSAPNYLQNPGEWYRITFQTLEMNPPYAIKMEVPAARARDTVFYVFQQLSIQTSGIEQETLDTAAPLVTEIFKEAQRLPAEIYTSVLESRTGAFRITPQTRQRRKIEPSQTFAPELQVQKPKLGAAERQEALEELPERAVKPGEIGAPSPDRRLTRPRAEPRGAASIEESESTQ